MKHFIGKFLLALFLITNFTYNNFAQEIEIDSEPIYNVNWKWELPLTGVLFATDFIGLAHVGKLPGPDSITAARYRPADVWGFDRGAIFQDPDHLKRYNLISDWVLNFANVSPAILALDPEIRKDWVDLLVLYGETHAINGNIYIAAASLTEKPRPLVYNNEIEFSEKLETGTMNSFFSGHVSTAATATFFAAKVYSDYHPELGNKKYWFYAMALLPPAVVGYYRYKAMKHFPTDVLTGLAIGSAMGILIPHWHKNKKYRKLSIVPYTGNYSGVRFVFDF